MLPACSQYFPQIISYSYACRGFPAVTRYIEFAQKIGELYTNSNECKGHPRVQGCDTWAEVLKNSGIISHWRTLPQCKQPVHYSQWLCAEMLNNNDCPGAGKGHDTPITNVWLALLNDKYWLPPWCPSAGMDSERYLFSCNRRRCILVCCCVQVQLSGQEATQAIWGELTV